MELPFTLSLYELPAITKGGSYIIDFIELSSNGKFSEFAWITPSTCGDKSLLFIGSGRSFQNAPFEYVQSRSKRSILYNFIISVIVSKFV